MNEVRLTTGKNQQYLGNVKEEELGIQSQENSRNENPRLITPDIPSFETCFNQIKQRCLG